MVVTAHGRDPRTGSERLPGAATVAVLTAPGAGAAELGAGLIGWSRRCWSPSTWAPPPNGSAR